MDDDLDLSPAEDGLRGHNKTGLGEGVSKWRLCG